MGHRRASRTRRDSRWRMAARMGHPFPVPLKVYDQTIHVLKQAVARARLGNDDKLTAIARLDAQARWLERAAADGPRLDALSGAGRWDSPQYGGRTVAGVARGAQPGWMNRRR